MVHQQPEAMAGMRTTSHLVICGYERGVDSTPMGWYISALPTGW